MRLDVCVNELTPFGPFAAIIKGKHPLTAMAQKKVCPQDERADLLGTNVLLVNRHCFAEGFVSFRTLRGV